MISVIRNLASLRVPSSTVVSSLANSRDSCSYTAFSTPLSPVNNLTKGAIIRSLVRLTPVLPSFNPVLNTPPAINPSVKVLRRCSISWSASVSPSSATFLKNESSPKIKFPSSVPTVAVAAASPVIAAAVLLTAEATHLPSRLAFSNPFTAYPTPL